MGKELSPETKFMVKVFNRKPDITFQQMKAAAEKAVAKGASLNLDKIIPVTFGVAKRAAGLTSGKMPGPKKKTKAEKTTTVSQEPEPVQNNGNVMESINRLISEHERLKALVAKFIGEAGAIVGSTAEEDDEVPF